MPRDEISRLLRSKYDIGTSKRARVEKSRDEIGNLLQSKYGLTIRENKHSKKV